MDLNILFFLLTFCTLVLSYILIHAILLRASFIKLLLILELFFLIIIFGFLSNTDLLFATLYNVPLVFCLIAIAACEAVVGLALLILRTRILTTNFLFTHQFIYYKKSIKIWLKH